jgi:GNAT superfamily N-acetyltransferase
MFSIRHAEPDDAGEVLTVQRAAFVTEAQLHDDVHMEPLTQTLAGVRAAIDTATVLVAVSGSGSGSGSRIVGSVRAHEGDGMWRIGKLVVVPDLQGRGIGSKLLAEIENAAPGPISVFTIQTGPKSAANVRLYERHGYRQVPDDSILIRLTKRRGDG